MPKTRAEIDALLDQLAADLPGMINTEEPDCIMEAFAGRAEPIRYVTSAEDMSHLDGRLNAMLEQHELLPPDE
ncbi:hypothetical protein [Xanthomonas arboricola]|uniref:Uncharacterized protein n=1 Tax=Xanthomonas arboricola TaxID=56448 RepID=A0AB73H1S4_9XANT|nr:hypothetical protein [Xanthomonas arboricola]MBB5672344.1 hypothetical protein [Xanthomonas arboricola]